jgi:hypothetical protein
MSREAFDFMLTGVLLSIACAAMAVLYYNGI